MKMLRHWLYFLWDERGSTEDDDEDITPNDDGGLDVDLDDDDMPGEDDDDGLTIDDEDEDTPPKTNKAWAEMRIKNKKLKERLEKIESKLEEPKPVPQPAPYVPPYTPPTQAPVQREYYNGVPIPTSEKEWDELAEKDWKAAVDLRSTLNAKNLLKDSDEQKKRNEVLDKSKTKVLTRHPELNDNNSEKARIYSNILQQNPQYLSDPKGPIHAMRDMEEYMVETLGYKPQEIARAEKTGAESERIRQSRVALNSNPGRIISTGNRVVLSKDEVDFCKINEIDPKEFAKNKVRLEKAGKGGLQV